MPPKRVQGDHSHPAESTPKRRRSAGISLTETPVKLEVQKIQWDANPRWTDRLVTHLAENPDIRLKIFSDSAGQAKEEGRKKVVGGKAKITYYRNIAKVCFDVENEPECTSYTAEPGRYATSVMGRLNTLQKTYQKYRKSLRVTGQGVKDDDENWDENKIEQVRQAFPWWDMLHEWWSKQPKHDIDLITNSNSGVAKMAKDLEELVAKDDRSPKLATKVAEDSSDEELDTKDGVSQPTSELPFSQAPTEPSSPTCAPGSPHLNLAKSPLSLPTAALQKKGESSCTASRLATPRPKRDYIADLQEATRVDQQQSQREAEQLHTQKLKMIEYKTEKLRLKHLKVQLWLAELGQQSAAMTHQPHMGLPLNTHLYGPGQPAPNSAGLPFMLENELGLNFHADDSFQGNQESNM